MRKAGILIVSASTGTGHRRAAEAVRQQLLIEDPAAEVTHIDLLDLAPSWVRATYGGGYELMATRAPWLWEQVYRRTDGDAHDRARWSTLAERLLFREFRKLLLSQPWRLCICTHFLPCQLAAGRPGLPPFALAITDFTLHRFWVQPGVRQYFVATEDLAAELRQRVPGATITVTGIPIDPAFSCAPSRLDARMELGLEEGRQIALVMGGGLGLGVAEMVLGTLEASPEIQVLALCGKNGQAKKHLESLELPAERIRVEGFVSGVERYIAAANVVITKPGGLTTSEALAVGRPLVLARPIPGQETGNVRALVGAGAALAAADASELTSTVRQIFSDESFLRGLAANAARLGRPGSARHVVEELRREVAVEAGGMWAMTPELLAS